MNRKNTAAKIFDRTNPRGLRQLSRYNDSLQVGMSWVWNPVEARSFSLLHARPDQLWGPTSLFCKRHRGFLPRVNRPQRDLDIHPNLVTRLRTSTAQTLLYPVPARRVAGSQPYKLTISNGITNEVDSSCKPQLLSIIIRIHSFYTLRAYPRVSYLQLYIPLSGPG